jgi:tetratricopeptide (TPR) repeat protein
MSTETLESVAEPEAPATPPARLFGSPREATLLAALLLALATLSLYEHSLQNGFVSYDDPDYVTANPVVRQGLSWAGIRWAFMAVHASNWHPLTWIAHMAVVQLFGVNPIGHHLVSVLFHTLNVVLLFLLLRKATGYIARSAVVAGLFAAFPLNVENIAWAAELKSLLCTTFVLLAIWAYGWYARRPELRRYLAVFVLFALALMAKPLAITLPFALLLLDYWPLGRFEIPAAPGTPAFGRQFLKLVAEKIPLLLLSACSALLTLHAQQYSGSVVSTDSYPLQWRIKNVFYSYVLYIVKGLWPLRLAVFYPYPGDSLKLWQAVAAAIVLLATTLLVWRFRRHKFLLAGWLWYLGTMVPMIGIVQAGHQEIADRYAYLPFIGLFVIAVWLASELAARVRLSRPALAAIAVAVLAGYASASYVQIGYWRNNLTLFSHAAQVTTGNAFAEENIGDAFAGIGRLDVAAEHYQTAARFLPRWSKAHYNLAVMLQGQHRFDEAAREYQLALAYETDPDEAWRAHINLGAAFVQLDRLPDAISEFTAALGVKPGDGLSLTNRGLVEYSQGKLDAAREDFYQASQHAPTPQSYFWLGRVQEDQGAMQAAADSYQAALRMAPNLNDAQSRLDALRQKLQR